MLYVYELNYRERRLRERKIVNLQDKKSEKHKAYGKNCNLRLKKKHYHIGQHSHAASSHPFKEFCMLRQEYKFINCFHRKLEERKSLQVIDLLIQ